VLYRGATLHSLSRVGVVAAAAGLHQPTVAYDGQRFLLWYSRDSQGGWAHELVFSSSTDGIHFTAPAVEDVAHGWYAAGFNPDYAVRIGALWYLYSVGYYSPGVRFASPGVYVFSDPAAAAGYPAMQPMSAGPRDTPKLDPSIVCSTTNGGWIGVFTAYGDLLPALFGYEWTETFTASSPLGPWHRVGPFIPLGPMLSLENPTPVASGPGAGCRLAKRLAKGCRLPLRWLRGAGDAAGHVADHGLHGRDRRKGCLQLRRPGAGLLSRLGA
jgi:hypothetical protein